MKKVIVPEKMNTFQRMIQNHNKGLSFAITNIIISIVLILLLMTNSNIGEMSGFYRFLMFCLFFVQIFSIVGIIIGVIQLIKLKKLKFRGIQLRNLILGFLINLLWFSGFATLIIMAIKEVFYS